MPLPVGLSGETQVPLQGSEAFREALLRLVALAPVERCRHRRRAAQLQGVDRLDDLVQVADHVGLVGGGQLQVTRFLSCRRHRQRRAGSTLRFRQSPISLRPPLAKSPVGRANLPSAVMHRREACAWENGSRWQPPTAAQALVQAETPLEHLGGGSGAPVPSWLAAGSPRANCPTPSGRARGARRAPPRCRSWLFGPEAARIARPSPMATGSDPAPTIAWRRPTARKRASWASSSSPWRAA